MGVPSFYRWLVGRYPNVVANAIEDEGESLDTSLPNPNGIEFDNLYLDMNGIIHPCFHPDRQDGFTPPSTFEEVFDNMFQYIDRLFNIVRPRNLLYMAIDGVAPRAKMNQQRSRRFRAAKDKEIAEEEELRLRRQFEMDGKQVLPMRESAVSDSNIITPGTDLMHKLSKALQTYVKSRLSSDLGWRNIKVILSDANVPGEGEHKIMSFIRLQRTLPSYDPNTRHCLYGPDADLIMLALATHEVHFSILREDVLVQEQTHLSPKPVPETSLSLESSPLNSRGEFKNVLNSEEKQDKQGSTIIRSKRSQFLHVWILREYLELDMQISDPPENFKFDIERIIDDFIFMCFFVGNDFLPHTPSLEIHEGAIHLLMTVYKKELKTLGGYLVDMIRIESKKAGFIKMSRVERFILLVGDFEEKILKKRSELRQRKLRQLCLQAVEEEEEDYGSSSVISSTESDSCASLKGEASSKDSVVVSLENISANVHISSDYSEILKNTKELEEKVKDNVRRKSDLFKNGDVGIDKVRLGSPGYKERYYREKFSAQSPGEIESVRKKLVEKYTEGLLWVLLCYFSGPPSWTWFYPYHYGPFTSDFKGLSMVKAKFQKGSPFKPFDQLLSVLPPRSAHALPKAYQALMNDDSPLTDFYPTDFEIDMDGKRYSWQGLCKLPLIDEGQIISETTKLEKDLSAEESEMNTEKLDQLLVRSMHKLGSYILSVSTECNEVNVGTSLSEEIGGFIQLPREYMVADTDIHIRNQEDTVLCVHYKPSDCGSHIPRLLNGVKLPEKTIRQGDIIDTPLWHEWNERKPNRYNNISETTHNCADSRWGSAGRGKIMRPIMNDHNSNAQNYTARRVDGQGVHPSFNSYAEKGTFHHDQGSFRRMSGSRQEWKKVEEGRSRDRSGNGSREITTPEWNCPMIRSPNRGYQPGNGSLRPSIRNSPWLQSSSTSQPDGCTSDQGRERKLQQSKDFNCQHNSSKAGYNSSMGSGQSGRG